MSALKISLEQLRRDLQVTQQDIDRSASPETRRLMTATPNAVFSVSSEYAFRCVCCSGIEGRDVFYSLVKENVGVYARKTDVGALRSTEGIVLAKSLDSKPEFDSVMNITRDGLVCDHCYDSVYGGRKASFPGGGIRVYELRASPARKAVIDGKLREAADKLIKQADKRRRKAAAGIMKARAERGQIP